MAIDSWEVVLLLLPWGQFWNTLKNSFTLFSAYAAMFSIPKGHMFLQSHELEASTLATGVEDFSLLSMNLGREALGLDSLSTTVFFLVEQQSGQLSLCHIYVRSALELWLSCPDQMFVQRSFCTELHRSFFAVLLFRITTRPIFIWMHLSPLFLLASLSPVSQEWHFCGIVSLCLPPALLLSAGQCVEGEHCASCQVPSVLWGVNALCKGHRRWGIYEAQIAITSSEIHK